MEKTDHTEKVVKHISQFTKNRNKANMSFCHRASIERKCPYMKKLKSEGNFPSYFDNDDVILHIFAKFWI